MDNQGAHLIIIGKLAKRLVAERITKNDATNVEARHVFAEARSAEPSDNCHDGNQGGYGTKNSPEVETAFQTPAINDGGRIKGHDRNAKLGGNTKMAEAEMNRQWS